MDPSLYVDDVVARKSDEFILGVVERTHEDVDSHDLYPGSYERVKRDKDTLKSLFKTFMKDGVPPKRTVLVRWQHSQKAELVLASKLNALDRSLLIGDVVRKNFQNAMTGIVINTFTKCTIRPIQDVSVEHGGETVKFKGLLLSDPPDTENQATWIHEVPASELKYGESPSEGEVVTYGDWIGQVERVNGYMSLRLSDNSVVEVKDFLPEHLDESAENFCVGDIVITKKPTLRTQGRWIYGKYNPNTPPIGTVVEIRNSSVEVTWVEKRIGGDSNEREPNAVLERDEFESPDFQVYDRTRRPHGNELGSDASTISNSEIDAHLNLRVRFKDLSGACVKYDGSSGRGKIERMDRRDTLGYDLNVFDVVKFHTNVTVQWQDLSITQERSIDVMPDIAIDDEHDAWPSEIVHPVDLQVVPDLPGVKQATKVGVVQSVNASERMAEVMWCPEACLQYSTDMENSPDHRAVLTGAVGDATGEQEEVSLYDVEAPGEVNIRRGDIVLISNHWRKPANSNGSTKDINWLGEIVDTCLDGSVLVRLGAAKQVCDLRLKREDFVVAIRSDGTDAGDGWDDENFQSYMNSDGEMEYGDDDDAYDSELSGYTDDYPTASSDSGDEDVKYTDENGDPMDEEDVEDEDWESENSEGEDIEMQDASEQTPLTSQSPSPPDTSKREDESNPDETTTTNETPSPPEPYVILDTTVPPSHHFATQPTADTPTQMKRIQKEHKILRAPTTLPKGVYVRTWESRLDLLRVLFIGPAETPYANAPFVIDIYLPPTFPTTPPQAFFHSWTAESGLGGVGRVNPNLYEDGKICLSLLGTWESEKSAGWNAGKSTLLQVLVSLLGLVLVKEPYFNEAGYEPLVGLESSRRSSVLYSERVYLKARTFVIAALTRVRSGEGVVGLEGLEDVVRWVYLEAGVPTLLDVIVADVEAVLERSEREGQEEDIGLLVMSKGACIPLRRVVKRLKEL